MTVLGTLQTLSLKSLNDSMKPSFRGIEASLQAPSFPSRLRNLGVKWLEAEQFVLPLPWGSGLTGRDGKVQVTSGGPESTKSCLGWIIYAHRGPQEGDHLGWPFSLLLPIPSPIHYQIQSILPPKYFLNLGLLSKSIAHTLAKVTTISHLRHGKKLCITLPLLSSPPVLE